MTPDRREAGEREPGEPQARPTIREVARHAEVSYQTVSNALNAPERLKPDTLARVLRSIEELGYRPSQAGRNLALQTTRLIGFRFARSAGIGTSAFEDRFLHALCAASRDRGYGVLVFAADGDDEEMAMYDDLTRRGAVDGFVLTGSHRLDSRPAWLGERHVPFICFGRPWGQAESSHSWLDVDGRYGVYAATRHLIEGSHRRIGFIGLPEGSEVGDDRRFGWADAAAEFGLPTAGLSACGPDGIAMGTRLADRLLGSANPPTALVCVSDLMAIGAMHAAEQRGLAVGRDLAVVGFDDSPLTAVVQPGLSSVRQPLESIAQQCVDLLIRQIDDPRAPATTAVVEPTVIVRASSAGPTRG